MSKVVSPVAALVLVGGLILASETIPGFKVFALVVIGLGLGAVIATDLAKEPRTREEF